MFAAGVDYQARDAENKELENEYYARDIQDEEYFRCRWSAAGMWPENGRVAEPRTEGPQVQWPCANPFVLLMPDWTRGRRSLTTQTASYAKS